MYKVLPNPLNGVMLVNENGVVVATAPTVMSLRLALSMMMERREISPFVSIANEFGKPVLLKDYVRV